MDLAECDPGWWTLLTKAPALVTGVTGLELLPKDGPKRVVGLLIAMIANQFANFLSRPLLMTGCYRSVFLAAPGEHALLFALHEGDVFYIDVAPGLTDAIQKTL